MTLKTNDMTSERLESSETLSSNVLPIAIILVLLVQLVLTTLIWRDMRALRVGSRTELAGLGLGNNACPGLELDTPAPQLTLTDSGGKTVSLLDDYRGQHILLMFSSTTCPYCRALYDDLVDYDQNMRAENVKFVMASLGHDDTANIAMQQEYGFRFPVLDATRDSFIDYYIPGTPTFVFIGTDGRIKGCQVLQSAGDINEFSQEFIQQ